MLIIILQPYLNSQFGRQMLYQAILETESETET